MTSSAAAETTGHGTQPLLGGWVHKYQSFTAVRTNTSRGRKAKNKVEQKSRTKTKQNNNNNNTLLVFFVGKGVVGASLHKFCSSRAKIV